MYIYPRLGTYVHTCIYSRVSSASVRTCACKVTYPVRRRTEVERKMGTEPSANSWRDRETEGERERVWAAGHAPITYGWVRLEREGEGRRFPSRCLRQILHIPPSSFASRVTNEHVLRQAKCVKLSCVLQQRPPQLLRRIARQRTRCSLPTSQLAHF